RSSAPNNDRNSECKLYSTDAKHHVSEGNRRRLLRESEDDETPQRARELLEYTSLFPCAEEAHCEALLEDAGAPIIASEETHREPAESVVYFRSGILTSQFIPFTEKA